MPIANCIITSKCKSSSDSSSRLIETWANESNTSSDNMTINIITSTEQTGHKYAIMASLLLPSIWSRSEIKSLQLGLAKALSLHYTLALDDIFITTSLVESGMVVEAGKEVTW